MATVKKKRVMVDVAAIGAKGGKNSRKNLDPETRKELAQRAAAARWGPKKATVKKGREKT